MNEEAISYIMQKMSNCLDISLMCGRNGNDWSGPGAFFLIRISIRKGK
ncbi:MAG: hypothetical protein K6E53_12780 [Lachnospiraceae bacterium]|nr:hypothetical protein [Lachnospiraceae bacterium]